MPFFMRSVRYSQGVSWKPNGTLLIRDCVYTICNNTMQPNIFHYMSAPAI